MDPWDDQDKQDKQDDPDDQDHDATKNTMTLKVQGHWNTKTLKIPWN